jgi:hypothetical protein
MPKPPMMSWFLFPPQTVEVQLDEKWCIVGKKEKNVDSSNAEDEGKGDCWDHTAIDAESRLLLTIVPGKRTAENCERVVEDVQKRTNGRTDIFFTSDEHAPYKGAIIKTYGKETEVPKNPGPGRKPKPKVVLPAGLCYATVKKTRREGRIVHVVRSLVIGTLAILAAFLGLSTASGTINTSFVERNNGTDRSKNSRKQRKTYGFSKSLDLHEAVSYFVAYGCNFMWPIRTLALERAEEKRLQRTPAMAAGLTDHIWSLQEWCTFPVIQS